MSDKKSKPFINMDFAQLYPHVMSGLHTVGFRRILRMIAIKKYSTKSLYIKIFSYICFSLSIGSIDTSLK
jgi:hypothetical protein